MPTQSSQMSACLRISLPTLKRLRRGSNKERKSLLKNADKNLVQSLCECASNTLKNNIPLTSLQHRKLAKHKRLLRVLAKKGDSWKKKKKYLNQKGGWIVPLLAPIVGTIISSVLSQQ